MHDVHLRTRGQRPGARTGPGGLHYNLERFYDPALGRYLSPDPLGLDAAPNHHAYVPNPLLWADPLGLSPACGGAGADHAAHYIKARLEALANDPAADAGEVADWAMEAMEGHDPLLAQDAVWQALDELAGADLMAGPGTPLHGREDFRAWLRDFGRAYPDL